MEEKSKSTIRLGERIVRGNPDAILETFLLWTADVGLELYPAQEEAVLELMAGRHVILNTPTGSGKSLVALALHFKGLCEGKRSYYTAPIKALVSEKFFALCRELGAENVGMMTGDASINPKAGVICCTAEILSNLALREKRYLPADYVIMDEFHYYGDRDRGLAWQVPLLLLRDSIFLLMSATLGDTRRIAHRLEEDTEQPVSMVRSAERPVPLDFEYRQTPLHETIEELAKAGKAPIYLVNFSQREAAEQAQSLTSLNVTTKDEKHAIKQAIGHFRFDTPYGKDIRRFITHGIGLHHAGLLPKYRLLVEHLAQDGHLKVISGTDTLGVGVNIPIRSVLFTRLYKFDGEKSAVLSVRDFKQIAGRAGRKGFDDEGFVVVQAPEHVIENKVIQAKVGKKGGNKKKGKKSPPKGYVPYDENAFHRLCQSEPEELTSSFEITTGILTQMLDREPVHGRPHGGYRDLVELIAISHESPGRQSRHRRRAAELFRSLSTAGIIELATVDWDTRRYACFKEGLQESFSLNQALSLYVVDALFALDQDLPSYPLDVLTLVEAMLDNPRVLLLRQLDRIKGEKVAEMKAQGMDYEDRMKELEEVTYLKPNEEFIYQTFDEFRKKHPWIREDNVRPKSIARDMVECYMSFNEYVKHYGLQRNEGVLLRYLTESYKGLVQTVPEEYKSEGVLEVQVFLRTMLEQVDSSLVQQWESMLHPEELVAQAEGKAPPKKPLDQNPKAFRARVRAEMHRLVKALSHKDFEEAALAIRQPEDDETVERGWRPEDLERAMAPYFAEHSELLFDARARLAQNTHVKILEPRVYSVQQTLLDPQDDNLWSIEARVDLRPEGVGEGPLLQVVRISD